MNPVRANTLRLSYKPGSMHALIPLGLEGMGDGALQAGISLIWAGDMNLSREDELPWRGELERRMGWPRENVFAVRQTHSRRLVVIAPGLERDHAARDEADGLVSGAGSGAVLTVTVADCLPVFISDPASGSYALVHSGWKGTGIARDAVREMGRLFGSRPGDLSATIGPGIGPCCYRVSEDRWSAFRGMFGEAAAPRGQDGSFVLDLLRANEDLLREAGVVSISSVADCTCCSAHLGSFRRQGQSFTRMLAFIAPRSSFAPEAIPDAG